MTVLANLRDVLYILIGFGAFLVAVLRSAGLGLSATSIYDYGSPQPAPLVLLAAGWLTVLVLLPWRFTIARRCRKSILGSLAAEIALVATFMLLFLGGAAGVEDYYRRLGFGPGSASWWRLSCGPYNPFMTTCRLFRGAMVCAWFTFALLFCLLALLLAHAIRGSRIDLSIWRLPFHHPIRPAARPDPKIVHDDFADHGVSGIKEAELEHEDVEAGVQHREEHGQNINSSGPATSSEQTVQW
ncbi:hypothetical protein BCR35DRAFT_334825 [Leucosporidium creatinivorum]|uniref:Uncharacterized protein n=1 Tax=Leucosporidium creatinivorum TaxID=106004 RepID=A0A1Y2DU95_9BASI|nr:hypothetical protein BCR35DRAFT_334825 [Leucosporidium creatinivorum]